MSGFPGAKQVFFIALIAIVAVAGAKFIPVVKNYV